MPKPTKMYDDAFISRAEEKRSEKEKLSEMSIRSKIDYLWEYYKFHALVVVASMAVIIYFIYELMTPDIKPQFYAALINSTIRQEVLDQYADDFAKELQLNPEKESVVLNDDFQLNVDPQYTTAMEQALVSYIQTAQVDVMIAPESEFTSYVFNGTMSELSDQLPTDIYSSLTDKFYLSDTEEDPQKKVYGIYLSDTKLYRENADNSDPYVLGIIANSRHDENTIEFIRYLFNDK